MMRSSAASLHARLLLTALLPLALLSAVGALVLHAAIAAAIQRGFDQRLKDVLESLVASVQPGPAGELSLRRAMAESGFEQVRSGWYWQIASGNGEVIRRSRSLWDEELSIDPTSISAIPHFVNLDGPGGEPLRALVREVHWPAQGGTLRFAMAGPRRGIDAEMAGFRQLLAGGVFGLLLLAALALWLQVRLGLRPLRRLGEELEAVEHGRRERLSRPDARELAALADKINSVLDQNQRMAARGRKLAGDLAHALKTPLSVLRGELVNPSAPVAQALVRLDDTVERHLSQASAAARSELARTLLAPLVVRLREMFLRLHRERAVDMAVDVPVDLAVRCESDDLSEMLGNLIDNAFRAARSQVWLSAKAERGGIAIHLNDDGPGIDADMLTRLGERGRRLDEQSGHGLGISIARDIAESYGGELRFAHRKPQGLTAQLWLPGG